MADHKERIPRHHSQGACGGRGRLRPTAIPSEEFSGIILQVHVGGEGPSMADHKERIPRHHSQGACGGRGAA